MASWSIATRVEWMGLAATFVSLAAGSFWIWHLCPQQTMTEEVAVFRVFQEYFAHTSNYLPLLVDDRPLALGSFHFAGEPLSFYHWGCYTYPALLSVFGGVPAQEALAALWYPLGIVELGLAAFVLGRVWFGARAGYWCTVAVVVIPDPTYWAAPILYFPFDRLIEASPGMAYACAAAAVSLVFVTVGVRRGSGRALRLGILGAFAAAFFKVNIIVASLPICFFVIAFAPRQYRSPLTRRVTLEFLTVALLALLASLQLRSAPTFWPDWTGGDAYFQRIATFIAADSPLHSYLPLLESGQLRALVARAFFLLVVTFQWFLLLFAGAWIASIAVWRRIRFLHLVPLFSLAIYVAFAVFLAPNQNGDPFELQHRTFLWYYFLIATWTAGALAHSWRGLRLRPLPLAVGLMLLVFPLYLGKDMRMPPGDLVVHRGFVDAARFLREQTSKTDAYLDSESDPWLVATALAERRSFVSWDPSYNFPGSGRLREVRLARWKESFDLFSRQNAEEVRDWSERHGVRWLLLHPTTKIYWPQDLLDQPAFQSQGYKVFDLSQLR
jgi:hypothetical protein